MQILGTTLFKWDRYFARENVVWSHSLVENWLKLSRCLAVPKGWWVFPAVLGRGVKALLKECQTNACCTRTFIWGLTVWNKRYTAVEASLPQHVMATVRYRGRFQVVFTASGLRAHRHPRAVVGTGLLSTPSRAAFRSIPVTWFIDQWCVRAYLQIAMQILLFRGEREAGVDELLWRVEMHPFN